MSTFKCEKCNKILYDTPLGYITGCDHHRPDSAAVNDMYKRYVEANEALRKFWGDLDTQLMVLSAHRYCLGRQSYTVGACIDWLRKHRSRFERNTVRIIVRDTLQALHDDRAGSSIIDAPDWRKLAKEFYDSMPPEDKNWIDGHSELKEQLL